MAMRMRVTVLTAPVWSGDSAIDRTPVAMVAAPGGGVVLCGGYYDDGGDDGASEQGYWVWRLDAQGAQVWTKDFVSENEGEPVALVSTGPQSLMLAGTLALPCIPPSSRSY